VFEGFQITIEVPLGYAQREQLLSFIESKFPGAEISVVHSEVDEPTIGEVLVRHDSATSDETIPGADSEAVLPKSAQ
jgi:F0F1-type ATP synthase delta subunit